MKSISNIEYKGLVDQYEELKQTARKINDYITEYNNILEELSEDLDSLADNADTYHEDQSEEWQQGDEGCAYEEWKDSLRSLSDSFEELDDPDYPHEDYPHEAKSLPPRKPGGA